jgi:hypothetical protein
MIMPKVFSKCLKDGKNVAGLFDLVYDAKGQPSVVVDFSPIGDNKKLARVLTINPQWLRRVQNPDFEYEYDGLIDIWKAERN